MSRNAYLVLVLGALALATSAPFVRASGAPSLTIAAWRCALAALVFAPFGLRPAMRWWAQQDRRARFFLVLSAVALAAHFALWIGSLEYTSVAAATLLGCTTPIWAALVGRRLLGDELGPRAALGIAVAVAGVVVVGIGDLQWEGDTWKGDLMALVAAWMAAIYMLCGRRVRRDLPTTAYAFAVYGLAGLLLIGVALLADEPLLGFDLPTYGWLVAIAFVPQVLGHTAGNWALAHLGAARVSTFVLLEPVLATLLAWAWLGEVPPAVAAPGGLLVITGLVLVAHIPRSDSQALS